jgi:hypothetical protein
LNCTLKAISFYLLQLQLLTRETLSNIKKL